MTDLGELQAWVREVQLQDEAQQLHEALTALTERAEAVIAFRREKFTHKPPLGKAARECIGWLCDALEQLEAITRAGTGQGRS